MMKKYERVFRVAVFLIAAAGFIWFLIPLLWQVVNIGNGGGLAVCLLLLIGSLFFGKIRAACQNSKALRRVFLTVGILFCLGALWSLAMTCCMFSETAAKPPEDATAVVLGSLVDGTEPSADLRGRIDCAAVYLKEHPSAKCIASGGRGHREAVTEASAIKKALVSSGIDPQRILLEESSVNTKENLRRSLAIMKQNGISAPLAIITDDYHEFRACSIARSLGVNAYAVPARTPWFIFSSCWSREVLALTKYLFLPK